MTRISPTSPNPIAAAEPRMTRARTNERTVFVELNNWKSNLKNLNNGPLTQLFDADKPKNLKVDPVLKKQQMQQLQTSFLKGELSESESRAVADPNPPVDTTFYQLDISRRRVDSHPFVMIVMESSKEKVASEQSDEGSLPVQEQEGTNLISKKQDQLLRRTGTPTLASILAEEAQHDVISSDAPESASPSASRSNAARVSVLNDDQNLNSDAKKERRRCCSSLFRSLFSKV